MPVKKIKFARADYSIHTIVPAVLPSFFVLIAILIEAEFQKIIGHRAFLLLYPAVFLGSFYGTRTAGLIATMMATFLAWYFFLPYEYSFRLRDNSDLLAIAVFFATGAIANILSHRIREARALQEKLEFQDIKKSEEQYRTLAESIPQLAWIAKPDGYIFWYNERWYNFTGKTPGDMEGWGWQSVHHPEQIAGVLERWKFSIATGLPFEMEFPLRRADGVYRWFLTRVSPVRDETGRIIRWFGTNTDIDEQRKARESLRAAKEQAEENARRVRSVLDSTAEGIWGIAVGGAITFVNNAAVRLLGYSSPDEMIGKNSHELVHSKRPDGSFYPQSECPIYNSFRTGESVHLQDEVLWRKDGSSFFADYRSTPVIQDGQIVGAVTTFIDSTERRRILHDLMRAKEQAERANDLKSAFLANMSHEIRTPLGVMMGFADLIVDPQSTQQEKLEFASVLRKNGQQLSVIINDILDLSKVESGFLNVESAPFSLQTVIDEIFVALAVKAKDKGLQLSAQFASDVPEFVASDSVRVNQVIWNLVGNAIKFTDHGSVALLVRRNDDMFEVEVADTGIGMNENDQERLFQPFTQADESTTRKYGGTGLGLSLSKKLARLLGGDLVLKSTALGNGSAFVFSFRSMPVPGHSVGATASKSLDTATPGPVESVTAATVGARVLLVEDSEDNQNLISRFLERKGVHADVASNGAEGVEMAIKGDFDVVFMDIQMPVMDGYTATQRLRELGYRRPIVALTAHAMSEVRKKCLDVGCNDHLTKPINMTDLMAKIEKYARRTRAPSPSVDLP